MNTVLDGDVLGTAGAWLFLMGFDVLSLERMFGKSWALFGYAG